jgi:uncharacterized NAD(P)/FAD-binding protein YdhS
VAGRHRPGPHGLDPPEGRGPVIAVVGGGASGTLAAIHLLRSAAAQQCPLRLALIDRHGRHGLGQAYATTHPAHLLNAPAAQMSAMAGDPDHLIRWAAAAGLPDLGFLPRQAYGRYLRDTLSDAQRRAQPLSRVTPITSDAVAIRHNASGRPLRLLLADGCIDADIAVLAIGSPPSSPPLPVPQTLRYIADPWAPAALDPAGDGSPVVILGTGLTMLDVAMTVTSGNRRTIVHAVSRHGLLPRVHRGPPAAGSAIWLPALSGTAGPVPLAELMWQVRAAIATRPGHRQEVMDTLRPHLPSLWQRMSTRDKRLFLRHVARYWEVHRHRMPPVTARKITELRCTGRLSVLRGRVTEVTEQPGHLRIRIDRDGTTGELAAGWLINATGPATDISCGADPLIRDLFGRGLARPDPLRLGIDASPAGAVLDASGTPSSTIFTLGPPLRGLWYETTAIPEIRDQAAALALRLTATIQARELPGSAA